MSAEKYHKCLSNVLYIHVDECLAHLFNPGSRPPSPSAHSRCDEKMLCGVWNSTKHRRPLGLQVAPFPSPTLFPPQAVCSISAIQLELQLFHPSGVDLQSLEVWSGWAWGGRNVVHSSSGGTVFCAMPIPAYKSSALHCQHH